MKITQEQITQLIEELKDRKNVGSIDARIADDCVIALGKLSYTNLDDEFKVLEEKDKRLESKIEAAKEILSSQGFWCELADKECVGLKSIVFLVDKALK